MSKNVLIVESPAKSKTIEKYLGRDYKVVASFGHVRDLPKSKLGIDVEHNYEPDYMIPRGSTKRINELKKMIAAADKVYLATDLDREGEAIAWHITKLFDEKQTNNWQRITFSEITKPAILDALAHPRKLNTNLVDAQQARRVLDRLVGYSLSPILWKKVKYGLSAGRVQSVALKFLVDREREIRAFKIEKYWTVDAELSSEKVDFLAQLFSEQGKKLEIRTESEALKYVQEIKANKLIIDSITQKTTKRKPPTPLTTSTLQQAAYSRLGYSTRRTMSIAQSLYEAGHISYMRTDSMAYAQAALGQINNQVAKEFGEAYKLSSPRRFKSRANAQEAHEAIRPTNIAIKKEDLVKMPTEAQKLYGLIRDRTLATQMPEAIIRNQTVDITAGKSGQLLLRLTGSVIDFDGFLAAYHSKKDNENQTLPQLKEGQNVTLRSIAAQQHETKPPARYSEAGLVKKMETSGVGRPSTYAPTISTLISRNYVQIEDKRLWPQPVGELVCELLEHYFDFVVDPTFTASMERRLDEIADGKSAWQPVIDDYYKPLHETIEKKQDSIKKVNIPVIETDEVCEKCGKKMVIKSGRFGDFLACSGWPECKNAKPIIIDTHIECPKCHKDSLIQKKTKKGRKFWGCKRYPDCDYATWQNPTVGQAQKNL